MAAATDVIVIGGGVIGLSVAWGARRSGHSVVLIDPQAGEAASTVAAGMLAPATEASFGEESLLRLNLLAAARFPSFVADVEAATGMEVGLRREGTLTVAYDAGDRDTVTRLAELRRSYGLAVRELNADECRRLEPFLSPDVRSGLLAPEDWSVDNRRLLTALHRAAVDAGVDVIVGRAACVNDAAGRVSGVALTDGTVISAAAVVLAAGVWSGTIEGAPDALARALRPVKGQLLRLRVVDGVPPPLRHTVHATVRGRHVYFVPRADGEVVVGASSEERGFDRTVTAGAIHDLLREASMVVPAVAELEVSEMCAGLRPTTRDNTPIVMAAELDGLVVATGHGRNGILQSAITMDAVLALLAGNDLDDEWQALRPAAVGVS